jgi:hypothetical protein
MAKEELAFDERTAEKEIAPYISEEIDGRNVLVYRYGSDYSIPIAKSKFIVNDNQIFSKNIKSYLLNVLSPEITINCTFKGSGDLLWNIYEDDTKLSSENLNLDKTKNCSYSFSPSKEEIDLVISGMSKTNVVANVEVYSSVKHHKNSITNSLLGVNVFYIERIILHPGDSVRFGPLGTCFKNHSKTEKKEYVFNKPIALRELYFDEGSPEVLLYFIKKGGRFE